MADSLKGNELLRLSVSWPLTIKTEHGEADGETRTLTGEGIFLHCSERLCEGTLYSLTIKPPERPFEVKGKVTWSNLDSCASSDISHAMGFYFIRIDEDKDRRSLIEVIANQFETPEPAQWQPAIPFRFTAFR